MDTRRKEFGFRVPWGNGFSLETDNSFSELKVGITKPLLLVYGMNAHFLCPAAVIV